MTSVALTGREWKLIHNPNGVDELYQLSKDPFELRNVGDANPDLVAELLGQLDSRLQRQQARGLQLRANDTPAAELDSATAEQLRALGYTE